MKTRYQQSGFTLVEILVATAIVISILSMVYGTYFVISKSTQAAMGRMMLFQQERKVLARLARQIRCSYAGAVSDSAHTAEQVSKPKKKVPQHSPDYFSCYADNPGGEILHLVTTSRFGWSQNQPDGLFEVTYKFDKSKGLLLLSQERFIATAENAGKKRTWRPIAKNIERLELAFFDGQQWLNNWSFKDKKKLPNAVKIDITFRDETHQTYRCGIVAYVCCRNNYSRKTQSGELVAKNK